MGVAPKARTRGVDRVPPSGAHRAETLVLHCRFIGRRPSIAVTPQVSALTMYFAFSIILCVLTAYALRGGLLRPQNAVVHSFDTTGLLMALAAFGAAGFFFGLLVGIALTFSVMLHEFGHVAAYRVAGHSDARFRLLPLIGGVAISNRQPATQAEDFFIALMGPGICVAPMVLAYTGASFYGEDYPQVSQALWVFAGLTGMLNFLNLLPLFPLDGGRCLKVLAQTFWKPAGTYAGYLMIAALAALAAWRMSPVLALFAALGLQGLSKANDPAGFQRPMTKPQGVLALCAYLSVAATHLFVGLPLIVHYIL